MLLLLVLLQGFNGRALAIWLYTQKKSILDCLGKWKIVKLAGPLHCNNFYLTNLEINNKHFVFVDACTFAGARYPNIVTTR